MQKMDGMKRHPFLFERVIATSHKQEIATLIEQSAHLPRTAGAGSSPAKRLLATTI